MERGSRTGGIDLREDKQLRTLSGFQNKYGDEYAKLPNPEAEKTEPYQYYTRNGTFETVDGEILYCIVREHTPDRVLQIGGGFSTRALATAFESYDPSLAGSGAEMFAPNSLWLEVTGE